MADLAEACEGTIGRQIDPEDNEPRAPAPPIPLLHRERQNPLLGEPGQRVMIPQGARPRLPAIPGEGVGRCPPRLGRVADIEHRELQAENAAGGRIDVAADTEEVGGVERLEIGGEAGHFQLADDLRPGGIGQIDDKQRVDLLEGAHVGDVADEPAGIDPFPLCEILDRADGDEISVRLSEDKHPRGGIGEVPIAAAAPIRRRHAQKAVVLIE